MKEFLGLVVISLALDSATDFVSVDSLESERAGYRSLISSCTEKGMY